MLDLQRDALVGAGIRPNNIYEEKASGTNENRPVLTACLKALRKGDTLIVWKFDRLGRNLKHLVDTAQDLATRGIGFKVLTGQGATIYTTTASGKLVFGSFAASAAFEWGLIRERTMAGLQAARACGRLCGRKFGFTKAQVRLAQAAMKNRGTKVGELCRELGGITRATLYCYRLRENVEPSAA